MVIETVVAMGADTTRLLGPGPGAAGVVTVTCLERGGRGVCVSEQATLLGWPRDISWPKSMSRPRDNAKLGGTYMDSSHLEGSAS